MVNQSQEDLNVGGILAAELELFDATREEEGQNLVARAPNAKTAKDRIEFIELDIVGCQQ